MKWNARGCFACQALGGLVVSEALREPLTPLTVEGAMIADKAYTMHERERISSELTNWREKRGLGVDVASPEK